MELILAFIIDAHQGNEFPTNRCAPAPYQGGQRCTQVMSSEGEQDWRGSGRIDK
jgi:hypothetical protein